MALASTMVVLRDPGEVYLLCHTGGDDAISWVEQIDLTNEGMRVLGAPAFSVQYHPEAGPGPHDSRYLFQMFDDLMVQHGSKAGA